MLSPATLLRIQDSGLRTVWFGDFFAGHLTQMENFITWTQPSGRLQLELEAENDFGRLPFGNFVQRLLQTKVVYAFSTKLILSSFTQYDSESRQMGINNRLRWTIRLWNRGWRHPIGDDVPLFAPLADQFVVRLRWIFRR